MRCSCELHAIARLGVRLLLRWVAQCGYYCVQTSLAKLLKRWWFARFLKLGFLCVYYVKPLTCRFVDSYFGSAYFDSFKSYKAGLFLENQSISMHNRC